MHQLPEKCTTIDIEKHNEPLRNNYVHIDAYSKRKLEGPDGKLIDGSSITIGKNDIWIAATTQSTDAILLTTDADFDHHNYKFINVKKILDNE